MIIQRLTAAIRRQDWFQVLIEILIVIVGIFLGLQVQAAYEARGERELELYYLHQLHDEIADAQPYAETSYAQINFQRDTLNEILTPYRKNLPFEPFSAVQCNALVRSHVINNFIAPITTIEELGQTGRSISIQNEALRRMIDVYKSAKIFADRQITSMKNDTARMSTKYPQVIDRRGEGHGFDIVSVTGNSCNAALASDLIGFGNDLIGNANRTNNYSNLIANQLNVLRQLHLALDQELGIHHEENAQ